MITWKLTYRHPVDEFDQRGGDTWLCYVDRICVGKVEVYAWRDGTMTCIPTPDGKFATDGPIEFDGSVDSAKIAVERAISNGRQTKVRSANRCILSFLI